MPRRRPRPSQIEPISPIPIIDTTIGLYDTFAAPSLTIPPQLHNSSDDQSAVPGVPGLYEDYLRNLRHYQLMLGDRQHNNDASYLAMERIMLRQMVDLGFFHRILESFRNERSLRVNSSYDNTNLSHRFLLQFVGSQVLVSGINALINERPLPEALHNIPMFVRAFEPDSLYFLDLTQTVSSARLSPDERLHSTDAPNSVDFTVNGQKLRLSIQIMSNHDAQSRYIAALNVRVTSNRGTNVRHVARLENYDRQLCFKRLFVNRPIHGFKFVRRHAVDGLYVREIE
jgi:hypothetical protein